MSQAALGAGWTKEQLRSQAALPAACQPDAASVTPPVLIHPDAKFQVISTLHLENMRANGTRNRNSSALRPNEHSPKADAEFLQNPLDKVSFEASCSRCI